MNISFFHYKAKRNSKGECPIYCRITINGNRAQFSTGLFCKYFSGGQVQGDFAREYNLLLLDHKQKITEIYTQRYLKGEEVSATQLLQLYRNKTDQRTVSMGDLLDIYREYLHRTDKVAKPTKRTYGHRIEVVEKYLLHAKLYTENPHKLGEKDMKTMSKYLLEELGYAHEYAMKCLLMVKQIINYAVRKEIIDSCKVANYPLRYLRKTELNALNLTELIKLEKHSFWSDRLAKVRDLFLFQVYTGMAFVDLCQFSKDNIQLGINNRTYIFYHRQKTKERAIIPFTPKIKALLEKYDYQLPYLSMVKYNKYLKEVATKCGINKTITSQVGRISCGMIYLNDGVSMQAVSKILGHSTIATTQKWYARANEFLIGEEFERVYQIVQEPQVFYGMEL